MKFATALVLTAILPAVSFAQTFTATYTGLYSSAGLHDQKSYQTGVPGSLAEEQRGYWVFDLSSLSAGTVITSATLLVPNPASLGVGLTSLQTKVYALPFTTYGNWAGINSSGVSNFSYIGGGGASTPQVSSHDILPAESGTTISYGLNTSGLNFLTSAEGTGFVTFGTTITNLDQQGLYSQYAFYLTSAIFNPPPVKLVINAVPEPSACLLLPVLGLAFLPRRRKL